MPDKIHADTDKDAESVVSTQRKKGLLKAGALQKAIFNSVNFSSIATDETGVIQIFNGGAENMLGYSAADVLNKVTPADFSDPQEIILRAKALSTEFSTPISAGIEALIYKASRGIEDIYELTYIRKDGSRFPSIVSVTALRDAKKFIIGYLLIGTDNTARKQIEAERQHLFKVQTETNNQLLQAYINLQANEEQLAVTLNSIGDAVLATDAKGRVTLMNPVAEQLTGWPRADGIGRPVADIFRIINQETRQPATIPVAETLALGTKQGLTNHTVLISRSGSEHSIADSCAPIRDHDGKVIGAVLVFRDVTKYYATQKSLRDNVRLIQTILNTMVDGIITIHADTGDIETVNPAAEKMFGYSKSELVGKSFKLLIPEVDENKPYGNFEKLGKRDKTLVSGLGRKVLGQNKDGRLFPMEMAVSEMWLTEQRYFTGILRDITERNLLNQELHDKNAKLEEAMSVADKANLAKSDFLSRMSHELRTPLNAVLGFSQLLESGSPPPTTEQKIRLQQITQAGWYLLDLINEILDLAIVESGQQLLSRDSISLFDVMNKCHAMIEPQSKRNDIQLDFVPFDNTWLISADRTRFKQVVINLLSNAIKYNRKHGSVKVTCSAKTAERIRISIQDSGAGLSPEKVAKLFQPFNRLGQENGKEEGTGIGLVVTKKLVELMGGSIGVTSIVGVGSEFWIEVMRDISAPPASTHSTWIEAPAIAHKLSALHTLLYVEDNPANLMLVEHIIANLPGVHMLSASNAIRGIALARTHLPDIILMDINLDGMNGIEAMAILRKDPSTRHIPVLALSANAMTHDVTQGLEAGFLRYLTKPIKVEEFLDALEDALNPATHGTGKIQ